MKIKFLIFFLLNFSICLSQDLLILTDGDSIKSKISKISTEKIQFQKIDNIEGPEYEILTNKVFKIIFENGKEEFYNTKAYTRNDIIDDPEKVVEKGNSVFITYTDRTSSKAEEYFVDHIKYWNYWNIVNDKNKAHFIIEVTIEKRGFGFFRMWATLKTIDGNEFKKTDYFKTSVNALNGWNAAKDLSEKLVEDYFKINYG